jgi:hypothetical protein
LISSSEHPMFEAARAIEVPRHDTCRYHGDARWGAIVHL